MVLDDVRVPIVLAPLAGGPSTPALAAAVCEAGGFGFLASGYLTGVQLEEQLGELRSATARPFGVNVFTPASHASDPAAYGPYAEAIRRWAGGRGLPVGEPRFDDDGFADKVALLSRDPAAVVSFTFGMPPADAVARLHDAGSEVWVTVTTPPEAAIALDGGADALVLQGMEAGGHRGSFDDGGDAPAYSTLSLLQLLRGAGRPLVATGGLMSGVGIAAVLAAGARAAQLGTAFLLCPEAGTSEPHREAVRRADAPTRVTRAFTGRAARGIVNEFMLEHDPAAVSAYPEIHHVTQPLRREARARGDGSMINLWAGQAYPLARVLPAGELVRVLATELVDRP
ncbi:MAG TPA: nitronate monooxygenase [Gaiellaceae bacterium]|jgi:nitronate monooxygenase